LIYGFGGYSGILRANALPIAIAGAVIVFVSKSSIGRSRYIPAGIKRAVIARDLKGEKFDSTKHHIDHIWPFVLGGGNTLDNLRVVERARNLKKGKKRPRLREML
jgi:5-methylcytosine-specific restriction endonuclease McrA